MANGKTSFVCPMCCNEKQAYPKMIFLAALSKEEQKDVEILLSQNTPHIKCPKCKSHSFSEDPKMIRVKCGICNSYDFCMHCQKRWISNDMKVCGNKHCVSSAVLAEELLNCGTKTIGNVPNIPLLRLCPKCESVKYPPPHFFLFFLIIMNNKIAMGAFEGLQAHDLCGPVM